MGNLNEGYFPPTFTDYLMMFVLSPWGFYSILLAFVLSVILLSHRKA